MMPRMMPVALLVLVCQSVAGQEVKVENEKALFPYSVLEEGDPAAFAARLSPDGTRALYLRKAGGIAAPQQDMSRELVLRDLGTGKDTVLPIGLVPDYRTEYMSWNFFDSGGKRIALMRDIDKREGTEFENSIYDIETGKLTPTGIRDGMARFDRTDKALVITSEGGSWVAGLPDLKRRRLSLKGVILSISPVSDLAIVLFEPDDAAAGMPRSFFLWDLAKDQRVAELPLHEDTTPEEGEEPLWSSDGRFICYQDFAPDGMAYGARVYDIKENKAGAVIPDTTAIAAGPRPGAFLLKRQVGEVTDIVLLDAATGRQSVVGQAGMDLLHATGKKALYAKEVNGVQTVHIADLVVAGRK